MDKVLLGSVERDERSSEYGEYHNKEDAERGFEKSG